nr:ribosomal protein S2 [Chaetopeltis orbicularis]
MKNTNYTNITGFTSSSLAGSSSLKTNVSKNSRQKLLKEVFNILIKKVMNFDNTQNRMETYKKMLKKSLHYGDKILTVNPTMKKFTRGQSKGKYLINLFKTRRYLVRALWFLTKYAYQKKTILFIGTSIPSSRSIATAALKTKSFFVNVRWLGGMLTNWKTMRKLIKKLKNLTKFQQTKSFLNSPKKEIAAGKKERERLEKYLKGMKMMKRFPQVVIMSSVSNDKSALLECQKMGICNFSIVDTDCNPTFSDFIVPANDNSSSSIKFLLYYFAKAILIGKALFNLKKKLKKFNTKKMRTKLQTPRSRNAAIS